jgi:ATP-dependent Clp protease ATP-binding subunit ClpB
LTDGQGRTVDFRNTLLIMTSNLGSERIRAFTDDTSSAQFESMKRAVLEEVRKAFRPEFLNRVDEIVVFHVLKSEQLRRIVDIQLEQLRRRLEARHITLDLTPALVEHIAQIGYEPDYGARPLKRAIQKELETPLSKALLEGRVRDGQHVIADAGADGTTFAPARLASPVGAA